MIPAHWDMPTIAAILVSLVIPLLSSLLSRAHWPQEITGLISVVLAGANGFFAEWAKAGNTFHWQGAATLALESLGGVLVGRLLLWKGTQTDAKLLAVGSKKPGP